MKDRGESLGTKLNSLYGSVDWRRADGVLHVAAIAALDRATIALGQDAPPSATDRFILGFARARAEALVTTGAILRAEPALVHRYAEDAEENAEWVDWRAATLGLATAPGLIVLSRTGDFPADHPAIEAAESGFIWTSTAGRTRLGTRVGELEVVLAEDVAVNGAQESTGLDAALLFARARGLSRITIEAGPSATRALYQPREFAAPGPQVAPITEVLLSLYQGNLPDAARAAKFASEEGLRALGLRRVRVHEKQERSGTWSFERYCADLA